MPPHLSYCRDLGTGHLLGRYSKKPCRGNGKEREERKAIDVKSAEWIAALGTVVVKSRR